MMEVVEQFLIFIMVKRFRWGTGCLLRETQWNLSTRMGESDTCTAFSFILTKTQTYLPNTYNVHSFPLIVAGTLTIPHWPLTSRGETKPILLSTTLTSGIFHTFDLHFQNIRVFMFLCRVFMFADMQSGDSVIIKAQVSMSSPLSPSQCQHHYQFHHFWRLAVLSWKVDNCAIPALKIQLSPKFSTNASISCHVRGGEGLKPLNGRLGSNWGLGWCAAAHCRQIRGCIGPVRLAGYFWALRCTLGHQLMVNILTYIIYGTTTHACINNSITMLTYCHKVVACVDEVDCAIHCQVRW